MEATIQESQTKAAELQRAQHLQAQALASQVQTQQTLQSSAQVSQALLDKAITTAANLHGIIDEAATRYKQTPGLHFTGTPAWTLCLVFLVAIGAQNTKFAVSIFFLVFGKRRASTMTGYEQANDCSQYRAFDRHILSSILLVISTSMLFSHFSHYPLQLSHI